MKNTWILLLLQVKMLKVLLFIQYRTLQDNFS